MYIVAKCLHFVMSYMKQNKKHKQTLESAQYGLEIIFQPDERETSGLCGAFDSPEEFLVKILTVGPKKQGW